MLYLRIVRQLDSKKNRILPLVEEEKMSPSEYYAMQQLANATVVSRLGW